MTRRRSDRSTTDELIDAAKEWLLALERMDGETDATGRQELFANQHSYEAAVETLRAAVVHYIRYRGT